MNVVLMAKSYAGNQHVRFEVGEVASYPPTVGRPEGVAMRGVKPRRGSLLYNGISRRNFLGGAAAVGTLPWWTTLVQGCAAPAAAGTRGAVPYADARGAWWKGNTHAHSVRSDGHALPEEVAALYKRAGYNFLVLTDHNADYENPDFRVQYAGKQAERFEKTFGLKVLPSADGKAQRTRTYDEICAALDEPGRFLTISGNEVSGSAFADNIHCNLINVRSGCKWRGGFDDWHQAMDEMIEIRDAIAGGRDDVLFTMNHPQWAWLDIPPEFLTEYPQFRFFEICNYLSGPSWEVPQKAWTMDKFWDVVNAKRAVAGQPLVYGVGSDDTHDYGPMYAGTMKHAWNMVRAEKLAIPDLMCAFNRGDFYASTGVTLREVSFDASAGTLRVAVEPKPGETYRIQFIGTRRGFDPKPVETFQARPPEKALKGMRQWKRKLWETVKSRKIEVFSDSIGETFAETTGTEAAYTLGPDDLYVRCKVFVENGKGLECANPPKVDVAWTQPVTRG